MTDQWERLESCPLCGAGGAMPVTMAGKPIGTIDKHGLSIPIGFAISYNECIFCGLIYQNPRLTDDALYQFYTGGLYKELTTPSDYKTEIARADRLVNLIEPLGIESVLDWGCGHGEFLQACKWKFYQVQGYDLEADALGGLPVVKDLGDLDGQTFDLVSMIHVIEHVQDPVAEIKKAMKHTRKYILIEVPLTDPANYRSWYLNLPHVMIFRTHTLVRAMQTAGVKVTGLAMSDKYVTAIGEI